MLMPDTVLVVTFPALSLTDSLAERFTPSPAIVLSAGPAPSMPESESDAVQWTFTSPEYQPSGFGLVVGAPVSVGALLSMFTPLSGFVARLSALSTAVPVTCRLAPSADSTWVPPPVQLLSPDSASAQPKLTVTFVLFQPLP